MLAEGLGVGVRSMLTPASAFFGRRQLAGFTLVETMVTVAIAGVLSSIALPGFQAQLQKARRAEVLVSIAQIQLSEERYRANATSYAALADIGAPAASPSGYYGLQATRFDANGYEVLATATGVQARDTACAYMRFSSVGLNPVYAPGPTASTANPADVNRRCWGT